MSLDPEDRYKSADALLLALEHFAADRRYTLSSRAVQVFLNKNLETASVQEETAKRPDSHLVTTIHFKRAATRNPPARPEPEVTPLDLAIG
jgi:hypothetical protein